MGTLKGKNHVVWEDLIGSEFSLSYEGVFSAKFEVGVGLSRWKGLESFLGRESSRCRCGGMGKRMSNGQGGPGSTPEGYFWVERSSPFITYIHLFSSYSMCETLKCSGFPMQH